MLHKMKLQEDPFERIKNGTKTVEFRLYDEKRQSIQIGDEIEFSRLPELQEKLLVKVIDLYKEDSFEKLFKKVFVGEDEEKIASIRIFHLDRYDFRKASCSRGNIRSRSYPSWNGIIFC